jgi:NADP-dependent 3-hydroxy acid dehydrogenase YdfG
MTIYITYMHALLLHIDSLSIHPLVETFTQDVNFWGSVYPTYYALPHLKASKGKLVVSCSAAGTVATSRMSFYNVRVTTTNESSVL